MPARRSRFSQFRSDVRRLIAEIEKHVRACRRDADREYRLQREAFEERRAHASRLTEEIAADEQTQWGLRDGDAQRVHESLRLSLDYFRSDA
ncbi:MAG: hypothetical protein ACE5G3_05665 [Gammaproteobacteria bacterium]